MATAVAEAQNWITKMEAAKALDLSTREVERMAERGLIQKRFERPRPGLRYARTMYLEAHVLKVREERESGIRRMPAALTQPETSQSKALTMAHTETMAALVAHIAKLAAPPVTKAWLTVDEAVDYCGLPAAELIRLLLEGLIYSLGRGPKTWRIQRASLDAYGVASHQ